MEEWLYRSQTRRGGYQKTGRYRGDIVWKKVAQSQAYITSYGSSTIRLSIHHRHHFYTVWHDLSLSEDIRLKEVYKKKTAQKKSYLKKKREKRKQTQADQTGKLYWTDTPRHVYMGFPLSLYVLDSLFCYCFGFVVFLEREECLPAIYTI